MVTFVYRRPKKNKFGLWFFGKDNDPQYPRYGGYALGYKIVSSYLRNNNFTVAQARDVKTSAILESWKAEVFGNTYKSHLDTISRANPVCAGMPVTKTAAKKRKTHTSVQAPDH